MGLDITFYDEIHVLDHEVEDDCYDDHLVAYKFPDHFPVTQRDFYRDEFCFEHTGVSYHWSSSYGGYGRLREQLSCVGGYLLEDILELPETPEAYAEIPFAELIHFADNEGIYGYDVAQKLLRDFEQYKEQFEAFFLGHDPYFVEEYNDYMVGLSLVGPNGLVVYH